MRKEIHEAKKEEKSWISKSTRIESKDADMYGTDEHFGQKPENEEALRLYFVILLHNLPLHTVACKECTEVGQQWKPKNTTLQGFFHAYAGCYTTLLGDRPDLAKWQAVTRKFLAEACRPNHKNSFHWEHVKGPDVEWTLGEVQCDRIAYITTFQYACAALQYKHFKA